MKKYLFLISLFLAAALSAGAQELHLPQSGNLLTIDLESGHNLEKWLQEEGQRQIDLSYWLEDQKEASCNCGPSSVKDSRKARWIISLYGEGAHYQDKDGLEFHAVSGFGGSVLYEAFPSLDLGIGLEYEDIDSLYDSQQANLDMDGSIRKVFLAGRLHPQNSFWYVPFGLGVGTLRQKEYYEKYSYGGWYPEVSRYEDNHEESGFLWFVGLGLQWRLNDSLSLGLEGRYRVFNVEVAHDLSSFSGVLALNIHI